MKILVHDRSGVPFTIQLAREFAGRGYEVLYSYAAFFQSPKGNFSAQENDGCNLTIQPMYLSDPFEKYSLLKRRFQEIEYAHDLAVQVKAYGPDVLILAGVPPDALAVVYKKCRHLDVRTLFWVQDLYGVAIKRILSAKLPVVGSFIGDYYIRKEKRILQQSDAIVLITEDFHELMDRWNISTSRRHVIHNWTPIKDLPLRPKDNEWSRRHGLNDKFCFLYSGTLGLKHNPELLLKLALHYRENHDVRIVVVSEGLGADWLREKKAETDLSNLVLFPFQPFENMPLALSTADVLVAVLEPDAGVYSAPSKVLTYLCAKRPLLLAVPAENLSARIVLDNEAGLVVPPIDETAFIAAADQLLADSTLRARLGRNARMYAERTFDIGRIGDRFEEILTELLADGDVHAEPIYNDGLS